ncbi:RhoGAP-domain-containing protein [Eremomyces bilateralis CBS 781.70]|uniref:RhoGAP-domain-containing protein n=1 Tax=Eremomyces bilateralis CBS 781.70 TaxID=1392243 RepID=A0A6G1GD11_9PEZI|nr:RhoGAP-domain-containing protein [Eremomyces bilateralis CBS 781.70]KAF1815790.1 RhoGAP-domain-containing protein [Eremomyces bilateralis CBS 781.70]
MATQRARAEPFPAHAAEVATSKRDLASWWKNFKRGDRKREDEKEPLPPQSGIFGVPLQTSIRYANVAISLYDAEGRSYIYGYVPIVVAKCGVFLKEKATDVEGIFRLSGSEKRIKELRNTFNSPDRYGKGLDWTGYTVHDAANILRRYFNQLPEPIIPLDFYDKFRDPLRNHQAQAVGEIDGQNPTVGEFEVSAAIRRYQQLITELPPLNRQLLLYILDLLAVFASKSDLNKMTTPNLSAIFQPGILSHPAHDMSPSEYRLSQDILIFLIEKQDHFLIGMQGTAADEKTVQEVESGPPTPSVKGSTPRHSKGGLIARSASNSSAGADSVRKFGGARRNVSVSSRHSRNSIVVASPVSPNFGTSTPTGGVHRANTVPTKKSPGLPSTAFGRDAASPSPNTVAKTQATLSPPQEHLSPMHPAPSGITPTFTEDTDTLPAPALQTQHAVTPVPISPETPSKDTHLHPPFSGSPSHPGEPSSRNHPAKSLTAMFKPSSSDPAKEPARRPNKLQKRRVAGSPSRSTNSSTQSLTSPNAVAVASTVASSDADPQSPLPPVQVLDRDSLHPSMLDVTPAKSAPKHGANLTISPTTSFRSHSTVTDHDEHEGAQEEPTTPGVAGEEERRRRRWRPFKSDKEREEERLHPSSPPRAGGMQQYPQQQPQQPLQSHPQPLQQHPQQPQQQPLSPSPYGVNPAAGWSGTSVHSNSAPAHPSPLTQPPATVPRPDPPVAAQPAPAPNVAGDASSTALISLVPGPDTLLPAPESESAVGSAPAPAVDVAAPFQPPTTAPPTDLNPPPNTLSDHPPPDPRPTDPKDESSRDGEKGDKRGPLGWMRGKLAEHKERQADRARAKSPEGQRGESIASGSGSGSGEAEGMGVGGSMQSLGGVVEEGGRSGSVGRGEGVKGL